MFIHFVTLVIFEELSHLPSSLISLFADPFSLVKMGLCIALRSRIASLTKICGFYYVGVLPAARSSASIFSHFAARKAELCIAGVQRVGQGHVDEKLTAWIGG